MVLRTSYLFFHLLRSYVIHHSHTEILRFFNARTRALARQWKLGYSATKALNYYMRSSCALTLAIKNQLKSRAAVRAFRVKGCG